MNTKSVFISSTFVDLKKYRTAVRAVIRRLELMDIAMEHFGSRDERPVKECRRLIREESDVFVGIYARRYGFAPPQKKKSITAMEYDEAVRNDVPVLIYLLDDNAHWPKDKVETGERAKLLNRFKKQVMQRHIVSFFDKKDQLAAMIAADLGRQFRYQKLRITTLRRLSDKSLEREQRLLQQLREGPVEERARLVSALSSLGSAAVVPALIQLMLGDDPGLADHAAKALEWGDAIKHGTMSPHPEVRFWSIFRIGENALRDHSWGVKNVDTLIKLLQTKCVNIRSLKEITHSLSKIGGRRAMGELLKLLGNPGMPPYVAVTALHGPFRFWKDSMFDSVASRDLLPEFRAKAKKCVAKWPRSYCTEARKDEMFAYLTEDFQEQILDKSSPKRRKTTSNRQPRRRSESVKIMKNVITPRLVAMAKNGFEIVAAIKIKYGEDKEDEWQVELKKGGAQILKYRYKVNIIVRATVDEWPSLVKKGFKGLRSEKIGLSGDMKNIGDFVEAWNRTVKR